MKKFELNIYKISYYLLNNNNHTKIKKNIIKKNNKNIKNIQI